MQKKAGNTEGEVFSLRYCLIVQNENNENQKERLPKASLDLTEACEPADGALLRERIELNNGVLFA